MKSPYEDILQLPHHVSSVHPPMGIRQRSAQFSPFAALTGYEDAIAESRRLTHRQVELSEDERQVLDEVQQRLKELLLHRQPPVRITYFVPDGRKAGGAYETVSKPLRRIDEVGRTFHMTDGQVIGIDRIIRLEIL